MNVSLFLYVKMKTASLFLYVKLKIRTSPLALEIFPRFFQGQPSRHFFIPSNFTNFQKVLPTGYSWGSTYYVLCKMSPHFWNSTLQLLIWYSKYWLNVKSLNVDLPWKGFEYPSLCFGHSMHWWTSPTKAGLLFGRSAITISDDMKETKSYYRNYYLRIGIEN